MGAHAIDARSVGLEYGTKEGTTVAALADVSLTLANGEFASIIGPSGCGKTSLLKVMGGLITPTRGEVLIYGEPCEVARRRAVFGIVFQNPTLLPWKDALDNVLLPLKILRRQGDGEDKAVALLQMLGLAGFEHRYPHELSGGMQQRVALARALIHEPEILLMDEPFGALDELTRERLNIDLLRVWQHTGKAAVFVTHSIPEAVFLSTGVVVMSNRPGTVSRTVPVNLPYPRTSETRESPQYFAAVNEVRRALNVR